MKQSKKMIVMPANATGWFWHSLARETSRIGHLYSPKAQRGPWPWFPYACDNGAFSCWNPENNTFDDEKWKQTEIAWKHLMVWCQCAPIKPRWAIVPDVPGNSARTLERWLTHSQIVKEANIPLAIAVQDGMTPNDVKTLELQPDVICVGGSTDWKWETAEMWCKEFDRVHILRVNSPEKLYLIESWGAESCDGTGWNRGDSKQTAGLEKWCRERAEQTSFDLWPYVCKQPKCKMQTTFA